MREEQPGLFNGEVTRWQEAIECPACKLKQFGTVEAGQFPFPSYVHRCTGCGYDITESEWNIVNASEVRRCV